MPRSRASPCADLERPGDIVVVAGADPRRSGRTLERCRTGRQGAGQTQSFHHSPRRKTRTPTVTTSAARETQARRLNGVVLGERRKHRQVYSRVIAWPGNPERVVAMKSAYRSCRLHRLLGCLRGSRRTSECNASPSKWCAQCRPQVIRRLE
jgi:hypothetical protein